GARGTCGSFQASPVVHRAHAIDSPFASDFSASDHGRGTYMPARSTLLQLNRPGDAHERAADATASRVASSQGSQTLGVPAVPSNEAGEARTRLPAPR